jgi:hypothetical protein
MASCLESNLSLVVFTIHGLQVVVMYVLLQTQLLSPAVIFGYILKSPFGGDGWIVSVDNMEDIIGGHIWIGTLMYFRWYLAHSIQNHGLGLVVLLYGLVKLIYHIVLVLFL